MFIDASDTAFYLGANDELSIFLFFYFFSFFFFQISFIYSFFGHFYKSGVSTAPRLSNFIFSFFKLCDDFLGCSTAFSAANGLFSRDSCLVLCRRRHRRRTNPIKAKYLFANQHLNSAQVVRQVHQTDSHLGSRTSYRA